MEPQKIIDNKELYKGLGSTLVLIIADSGAGKSTALRNLPPEHTFIFNVMGKLLPFPGAPVKYKIGLNMEHQPNATFIVDGMKTQAKKPEIDHIVIDDAQYIMATEFMQKAMIPGWEKFTIMAKNMWDILTTASYLRDGLKVFVLAHEDYTPGVVPKRKMKTLGKLLDDKITPEGLSTIVLFGGVTAEEKPNYFFQTQSDGICVAKSPMGMFPLIIPNDLWLVSQRIDEYYRGVELKDSKLDFGKLPQRNLIK